MWNIKTNIFLFLQVYASTYAIFLYVKFHKHFFCRWTVFKCVGELSPVLSVNCLQITCRWTVVDELSRNRIKGQAKTSCRVILKGFRDFIDSWYVRRAVVSKGTCGDWEDHDFSVLYFILPVAFYVCFLIQLWQMYPSVIITIFLSFLLKYMVRAPVA